LPAIGQKLLQAAGKTARAAGEVAPAAGMKPGHALGGLRIGWTHAVGSLGIADLIKDRH
jgi:hypothetical protein